ncbi:MAG TPA: CHAD domain-containing protein [Coleofasciculaceae cyanobacterium]
MTKTAIPNPTTFGDWAYLAIEKHYQKTLKHEADVLDDKDPEALHQMRVGMRRLRTAVTGFAYAIALPKAAQEKKIGKVARRLGELRDLDVLQDTLQNDYLPKLPPKEQDTLKKVLTALDKQRRKSLEHVQATLKGRSYHKLKQAFDDWLEKPTYGKLSSISIYEVLPEVLLPSLSDLFLQPAWLVGANLEVKDGNTSNTLDSDTVVQLLHESGDLLHTLRKQGKQVRYQMELFTGFYGDEYKSYVKDIKCIQSILGHIQDSFVLAEFLRDTLGSEITEQVPTLFSLLTDARYQSWQEWQALQQRYLNPQTKINLYQTVLKPMAPISSDQSDSMQEI